MKSWRSKGLSWATYDMILQKAFSTYGELYKGDFLFKILGVSI